MTSAAPIRIEDKTPSILSDQDLPRLGGLLQPSGDVHSVTGDERLAARWIPRHDLAGIHADPSLKSDTPGVFQFLVEPIESCPQVISRPYSTKGVVLVGHGNPEDGHHCVADELLDRPSVSLDLGASFIEVAGDDLAERLGIQPLAKLGGAGDVGEQCSNGLPCFHA
jgi:hypothetical protein